MYIYIYIYILACSCRYPSTMQYCSLGVLLDLEVCPGVLHEYVTLAACPGVHLEPNLVNLLVQVAQGRNSSARKVQLARQGQLIRASTYPDLAVHD